MLLMGLSLFSGVWILATNIHVDVGKKGFDIHFSLWFYWWLYRWVKCIDLEHGGKIPTKWENNIHICFMEFKTFGGPKGLSGEKMIWNLSKDDNIINVPQKHCSLGAYSDKIN